MSKAATLMQNNPMQFINYYIVQGLYRTKASMPTRLLVPVLFDNSLTFYCTPDRLMVDHPLKLLVKFFHDVEKD